MTTNNSRVQPPVVDMVQIDPSDISDSGHIDIEMPAGSVPVSVMWNGADQTFWCMVCVNVRAKRRAIMRLLVAPGVDNAVSRAAKTNARYIGSALVPMSDDGTDVADWHVFHEVGFDTTQQSAGLNLYH